MVSLNPMTAQRIRIIGEPASGKTTLARRLSLEHGLPNIELDAFFWNDRVPPYAGVRRNLIERDLLLEGALAKNRWVIEGVYYSWCAATFERAQRIIVVSTPGWVRNLRLWTRHVRRRIGLEPSLERESLRGAWTTSRWNWRWDQDNLPKILELLETYQEKVEIVEDRGFSVPWLKRRD